MNVNSNAMPSDLYLVTLMTYQKAVSHHHETFGSLGYLKNKTGHMIRTHCPLKVVAFQGEHILYGQELLIILLRKTSFQQNFICV